MLFFLHTYCCKWRYFWWNWGKFMIFCNEELSDLYVVASKISRTEVNTMTSWQVGEHAHSLHSNIVQLLGKQVWWVPDKSAVHRKFWSMKIDCLKQWVSNLANNRELSNGKATGTLDIVWWVNVILVQDVWVALQVQRWVWIAGRWSMQRTACNIAEWQQHKMCRRLCTLITIRQQRQLQRKNCSWYLPHCP